MAPKLICEKCGLVIYCDQNCQNQDRENHKELCSSFQKANHALLKRQEDHDYCDKHSAYKIGMIAFNEGKNQKNYLAFEKASSLFQDLEPDKFAYKNLV